MAKILILGGGFGGIRAALDLEKKLKTDILNGQVEITLIDKNGYHLFTPALYEIASAYGLERDPFEVKLKRTICMPYADIFKDKKINFIEAEIAGINLEHKSVLTTGGHTLEYDHLVFALGAEINNYNTPGVVEYAHLFKNLDDALFINQKLSELSEAFTNGTRTEPYSFLICGGGFTGIEVAAELGCCSKVIKDKCRARGRCSNITIFEAGPKILPAISEPERNFIKKRLTQLGIILMENSPIEEVGPDYVKLKSGHKVKGDLIIWTAGTKPHRLLTATENLPLTPSGRIKVTPNLSVDGFKNIFALGVNADINDSKNNKPAPAFAYVAIDQAKVVAQNIFNTIKNKKLKKYYNGQEIWIMPIGGKFALVKLWWGIHVKGYLGWIVREIVDLRYLLSIFSLNKALEVFFSEITIFSKND